MTCLTTSTVEGCFNGQVVLIQLSNDGKGKPAIRYTDVAGDVIAGATAANVTVGACIKNTVVVEKACYGIGTQLPLATDVLFDANTGLPLGVSHGATSASDSYLHAIFVFANNGIAGAFNADDATSPFDCATHGGILLTDVSKVQAATNAAIAAAEIANGVPAGTYKATYYLTLTNQSVWAYNAALAAVVANGTYLHPYTGATAAFCNYQEKHDINVPSSFTEADLAIGKFPIEITKVLSPAGDILSKRVFDDRDNPPTEIVGFDPLLIVECTAEVKPLIPEPTYRDVCVEYNNAGTIEKWSAYEVVTTQADGTKVVTYADPDTPYPYTDITALVTAFNGAGCSSCMCNGSMPAVDVSAGSLGIIAGATRAATPAFTGAPATVNTSGITGKLQSITVTASGITDGLVSVDSVTVTLPSGVPLRLFNGQSFTWSVARNQDDEILKPIAVTASGNAYANVGYTTI